MAANACLGFMPGARSGIRVRPAATTAAGKERQANCHQEAYKRFLFHATDPVNPKEIASDNCKEKVGIMTL
jgi:hypothetical protein